MYLVPGQVLEVKLAGAVATNQLPVTASYFEGVSATMDAAAWGAPPLTTNGTTPVTVVGDPGAGKARQLKLLTIRNKDTAPATVTVQVTVGAVSYEQWKFTLAVDDYFEFTDTAGAKVLDSAGCLKSKVLSVFVAHATTHLPWGSDPLVIGDYATFTFATGSPMTLKAVVAGNVVHRVQVMVDTPFDDPAATIQIGTIAVPNLIFAAGEADVTAAGQYESTEVFDIAGPTTLRLTITPGTSSAGSGRILFFVRA